jgi:RNA polymerase sigma-70 factor (ECF subfamily)
MIRAAHARPERNMSEVNISTQVPNSVGMRYAGMNLPWVYSDARGHAARSQELGFEPGPLARLMERYAKGDEAVFEQLYALLAPQLYRFCARITSRTLEAEDCFQETLLRLHRARATYMSGANVVHWAYAIARSVYLTHLRYRRRRPEETGGAVDIAERDDLQSHESTPEAEASAANLLDIATLELRKMSEKNRVAYVLLKEEGVSAKHAAAVLGMSVDAVKQRAHRAYQQIRTALDAAS